MPVQICEILVISCMETDKVVHFLPCKPVGSTKDCKQTKEAVCVK